LLIALLAVVVIVVVFVVNVTVVDHTLCAVLPNNRGSRAVLSKRGSVNPSPPEC